MSHNSRIRPNFAAWATGTAITQTELDLIDQLLFAALNADAGGVWSPAAAIVLGGLGLQVTGPGGFYGSSGFNAVAQAKNWQLTTLAASNTANTDVALAYDSSGAHGVSGGNRFCAIDTSGIPYTSEDGVTWTAHSSFLGTLGSPWSDLQFWIAGPGLIVFGTNGKTMSSSDGGITFGGLTGVVVDTFPKATYAASLGLWVAAGATGALHTSTNGTVWTARTTPAGWIAAAAGVSNVVWNGSLFVITPKTSYNKFLTSPDGITWTERTVTAAVWQGLAWGAFDARWLATNNLGGVWISSDGINWSNRAPTGHVPGAIAVNKSLWLGPIGVGAFGGVSYSTDIGLNWTPVHVGSHLAGGGLAQGYPRVLLADDRFIMPRAFSTFLEFALSARSS